MAHAKQTDLTDIRELLDKIRTLALKEKSFGCFYSKNKAVLHFHVTNERRYAHVFDGEDWIEIDISAKPSNKHQNLYYKKISQLFSV